MIQDAAHAKILRRMTQWMTPLKIYTVSVQVQRATHCSTGQRVALKQVYVKQPTRGPSGLTEPEDAALREIAALQAINHPHVVTLHDVFTKVRRMPCCFQASLACMALSRAPTNQKYRAVHAALIQTAFISSDLSQASGPY